MVRKANYLLNQLKEHIPTLEMDGYMNIWILKPTNSSRGQGIHICRTLQYILDVVKKNPNRRYIIQKYIGRKFTSQLKQANYGGFSRETLAHPRYKVRYKAVVFSKQL